MQRRIFNIAKKTFAIDIFLQNKIVKGRSPKRGDCSPALSVVRHTQSLNGVRRHNTDQYQCSQNTK
jgi:hypothetical protein